MRYKFPMGGIEGARVSSFGGVSERGFCVESFTLSEMGDKLPIYADKLPIIGIDGALGNEKILTTCS